MFESSLVESTTLIRTHNRSAALVSFTVQATLIAALIAIPMLHPAALSTGPMTLSTLAPTPVPAPKPPPPTERPRVVTATAVPSAPSAPTQAANLIRSILTQAGPTVDAPALAISMNTVPMAPGLPSGIDATSPNVISTPTARPGPPVRVSQGVIAGLLIAPIQPIYPQIAKITRTEGTVVIQAVISKSGRIESAHAVSGPAILQSAALEAVRSAHYHPYLLNNEPTEVETTISIIFHIGS